MIGDEIRHQMECRGYIRRPYDHSMAPLNVLGLARIVRSNGVIHIGSGDSCECLSNDVGQEFFEGGVE